MAPKLTRWVDNDIGCDSRQLVKNIMEHNLVVALLENVHSCNDLWLQL